MKTLKIRIKDKHCKVLDQLASEVNFVWNYVNDLSFKHLKRTGEFFSAYDIDKYTKGASKECGLHSQTIQAISAELVTRRKQFKKSKLKWRVSNKKSARRSLGWIPFKKVAIKCADGYIQYGKHQFKLWDSYGLSKYNVKTGSFVEDSRGRWYVCLVVDAPKQDKPTATKAIGIDLGLKDIATCSNSTIISNPKFYRKYEQKLGIAQRAKNKKRVRALRASADVFKATLNGKTIALFGDFSGVDKFTFASGVEGVAKLVREGQSKFEVSLAKQVVKVPRTTTSSTTSRSPTVQLKQFAEQETLLDQELAKKQADRDRLLAQIESHTALSS